jgi:hypothetical protein
MLPLLHVERPPLGRDGLFFMPERLGVWGDGEADQTALDRTTLSNKLNYALVYNQAVRPEPSTPATAVAIVLPGERLIIAQLGARTAPCSCTKKFPPQERRCKRQCNNEAEERRRWNSRRWVARLASCPRSAAQRSRMRRTILLGCGPRCRLNFDSVSLCGLREARSVQSIVRVSAVRV